MAQPEGPKAEVARRLRERMHELGLQVRQVEARAGLGRTTVSRALNRGVATEATLHALARALRTEVRPLLELRRQAVPGASGSRPPTANPGVDLRSLHDDAAFAFEVHRAVTAPDLMATLPALPLYVERAHDRHLRAAVARAAQGTSTLVTLVGGSSTGKTRACWEAVRALPDGWRLWHPIAPTRVDAFLDGIDDLGPRTVVWLNDAQHYLLDPDPGDGERIAAALRTLLADSGGRGPVLVLATLWPEYWRTLTASHHASVDMYPQQRALLTQAGTDLTVPDVFTDEDWSALHRHAATDPRLALAAEHVVDGEVTQFLAGGPELLARYRNAPPAARAILQAAMDARRLGHGPALPVTLLADAAEGYVNDREYDAFPDDWLDEALEYCVTPCHGARGPLRRIRPRRADPPQQQPVYRLADYLEEHGRTQRRFRCPPATFWEAAAQHAAVPDLLPLGHAAEARGRYRHAAALCRARADRGDSTALVSLVELRVRIGDSAGAEELVRQAADSAGPAAAETLEEMRTRLRRPTGLWTGLASETCALSALLAELGFRVPGAEPGQDEHAPDADAQVLITLDGTGPFVVVPVTDTPAVILWDSPEDQVPPWRPFRGGPSTDADRSAGDGFGSDAVVALAGLQAAWSDTGADEAMYREAVEGGCPPAFVVLGDIRRRDGDHDEAAQLYWQAVDAGMTGAFARLVDLASASGTADPLRYGLEPDRSPSPPW